MLPALAALLLVNIVAYALLASAYWWPAHHPRERGAHLQ